MRPLILTMGDPAGVGPEIILKALRAGEFKALGRPVVVAGDPGVLLRAAGIFNCEAKVVPSRGEQAQFLLDGHELTIQKISSLTERDWRFACPTGVSGRAMADYVEWAVARCLDGSAAGLVTCPISKAGLNEAGVCFPGHTEMLAARCGVEKVVMMLAGERLKVCLVTTHLPLADVPKVLTTGEILATLRITHAALRKHFGLSQPRLAVLGLNPHAGEGGMFGNEEQRLIRPAIKAAQEEGISASGPHSPDTLFHFAVRGACDAVICMYHDQGLIPLKLLHFDDGVNVTLGLPIIRTSVDHGTAYDLAGTGRASEKSLVAALRLAAEMAAGSG